MGAANLQVGFNYNAANIQLDSSAESAATTSPEKKKSRTMIMTGGPPHPVSVSII
jgi:hypothetical protein